MNREECGELLNILLDMGEEMIKCGAEIYRVENTIKRMALSYGAKNVSAYAITSHIVLTASFDGVGPVTESRRISSGGSIELSKLERFNALSRKCEKSPLSFEELKREIGEISKISSNLKFYFGSALAAGAFALLFGGKITDALVSAVVAFIICRLQKKFSPFCPNNTLFNFFAALLSGGIICAFCLLFPSFSHEKIIMGDIMLLIPGVSITNALRDVFVGDTVSGSLKVIESVFWTIGLAAGYLIPVYIMGVIR